MDDNSSKPEESCKIAIPNLTYIIELLLPLYTTSTKNNQKDQHHAQKFNEMLHRTEQPVRFHCVQVGSVPEFYEIPKLFKRDKNLDNPVPEYVRNSDIDVLQVVDCSPLTEHNESNHSPVSKTDQINSNVYIETNDTHPGYCRLRVLNPQNEVLLNRKGMKYIMLNAKALL
ncbi:uncharacterized protein LOC134254883 [Saccostrea cucullata]|uniref:uncharacterized protein LOC134254883 n=1 Tax=Saccostrea cuccullata TaxID=36930 RepID=UPI002ED155C0